MPDINIAFIGDDQVTKTMKGIGGGFAKMGKSMAKVGLIAGGAVAGGIAVAGGALAAFTTGGIKKAAALEQQMANIGAVMGKTAKETKPLKDLILDLGVDPGLKVSTFEAADAIELLARNGLDMTQIMDGAAKSTVQLANATGADFGAAADVATDVMSLFNIEAKDMGRAVDGITSVANNSKFSFDDFRLALAQAGSVAAVTGVGFEDFNTTIAAIASGFASGSDAGTSFKAFLQRVAAPTDKARELMVELGLATEDGKNLFFDAAGNMKNMGDVAGLLRGALSGLSEEQQAQALATLFGADASRAAAELAKLSAEEFGNLQAKMAETSAADSVTTRMDTLSGAMEILQGTIEGVAIKVGDAFLPGLRLVVEAVQGFVDQNGEKLIQWFGTAALWFGQMLPAAISTLTTFWTGTLVPAFKAGVDVVNNTILPILKDLGRFIQENLPGAIRTAASTFQKFSTDILPVLVRFVTKSLTGFQEFRDKAVAWFEDFRTKAQPIIEKFSARFQEVWEQAGPVITDALERIGESIQRIIEAFGGQAKSADSAAEAASVLGEILDGVVLAVQAVTIGINALAWGFEKVSRAIQIAKGIMDLFGQAAQLAGSKIPPLFQPGSPPPLAVAMQQIAEASGLAAKEMSGFGRESARAAKPAAGFVRQSKAVKSVADREKETEPDMRRKRFEKMFDSLSSSKTGELLFDENAMRQRGEQLKKVVQERGLGFLRGWTDEAAAFVKEGKFFEAAREEQKNTFQRLTSGNALSLFGEQGGEEAGNVFDQLLGGGLTLGGLKNKLMPGGGGSTTNNQNMNLNINSSAPTENLAADFNMMKASMAPV